MVNRIAPDHARFREIVRGRVRKDLRQYISRGDLVGRQGRRLVSIPIPQVRLPRFRFGSPDGAGVGQGDGAPGTPLADDDTGVAGPGAGDQPGAHLVEVDFSIEELAEILGEALELPRVQPRGRNTLVADRARYTGIARVGPESLRHFKRTYREALKRTLAMGLYDPARPVIIPHREDRRYRSWRVREVPQHNAVLFYIMDVSGSMGDEQKEIVRTEAFWIDAWLRSQYRRVVCRYLVHDAAAREVDRDLFYRLKESGGTKISSAYELLARILRADYGADMWNLYVFQFSDGDNWGSEDTQRCVDLLTARLLPPANLFCYGQVKSAYGSGQFKRDLDEAFPSDERLLTSEIRDRDGIYDSIRQFLGKGK